jgi:hypothetical protein
MNLINQINEKFQQVELPFMAFEHDNSIFIKGRGFITKTNIQDVKELDYNLQLLSVIKNTNPQLANERLLFNENEIDIVSFSNENSSQHLSITINDSVEISNHVQYDQTFECETGGIYQNIPIELSYSKSIITTKDDAAQELKNCLSLMNQKLDIQKDEMTKLASAFNHNKDTPVQNSNVTESKFSYPTYDGPIEIDNLNEWLTHQGLPFTYVEGPVTDTTKRIALRHNNGHVLSFYTNIDGQPDFELVSDLNFFNQLYHIDPKSINDSFTTSDDGIVTNLDSPHDSIAQIDHNGSGIIKIIVDTNITSLEHNNMYTTHEGVSVRMNPSFTIMTNLDNFKKDMELVSQTSKDISSKLNEYGTKITDKLLVNELKLDDLKTIDQNIQL